MKQPLNKELCVKTILNLHHQIRENDLATLEADYNRIISKLNDLFNASKSIGCLKENEKQEILVEKYITPMVERHVNQMIKKNKKEKKRKAKAVQNETNHSEQEKARPLSKRFKSNENEMSSQKQIIIIDSDEERKDETIKKKGRKKKNVTKKVEKSRVQEISNVNVINLKTPKPQTSNQFVEKTEKSTVKPRVRTRRAVKEAEVRKAALVNEPCSTQKSLQIPTSAVGGKKSITIAARKSLLAAKMCLTRTPKTARIETVLPNTVKKSVHPLSTQPKLVEKVSIAHLKSSERELAEECLKSAQKSRVDLVRLVNPTQLDRVKEAEKRLSTHLKPALVPSSVYNSALQPNRMLPSKTVSTSVIKNTPSHIPQYHSVSNLNRISTIKYTTPLKASALEEERRRKLELAAKEAREKERLVDIERQRQEKLNEAKKKREEKMKKVVDAQQKQKEERENKAKCMTAMQIPPTKIGLTQKPVLMQSQLQQHQQNIKISMVINPATKITQSQSQLLQQHLNRNMETTYVLESPSNQQSNASHIPDKHITSYDVTPLQPPQSSKLKDSDNYDVSELNSDEDEDDDEQPKKPIPEWAQDHQIRQLAQQQQLMFFNFTKLFKSATRTEVDLDKIFKKRNKDFQARSSSAHWIQPPVWNSNGLTGDGSFLTYRI